MLALGSGGGDMAFLTGFPGYFVSFLTDLITVPHVVYAAAVAVFFGLATISKPGLLLVPVIAAIVYITALAVGPVVISHAKLVVPALDIALIRQLLAAYLAFLVADTLVYVVKRYLLRLID
jgi:hypothetical protein